MSIWCSWEHIGTEDGEWYEVTDGGGRGAKVEQKAERGDVRAYADGWSNHYPTHEFDDPTANIGVAHIPAWCVPGHREDSQDDFDHIAPWLRFDVDSEGALTWWTDGGKRPQPKPVHASVVMNEAAVRALRDDLTQWLETPKIHPSEEGA